MINESNILKLIPYKTFKKEELINISGIYCFRNKINNKLYIGQANNISTRISQHYHHIDDGLYFHNALKKYGIENFEIYLLEYFEFINKEDQNKSEIYYINKFDTTNPEKGYNLTSGGEGHLGVVMPQEIKDKISDSHSVPYIAYNFITKEYIEAESKKELVKKLNDMGYSNITASKIKDAANGASNYTNDFLVAHNLEDLNEKISNFIPPKRFNIYLYNYKKQDGIKKFDNIPEAEKYIREQGFNISSGHVSTAINKNNLYVKDFLIDSSESGIIEKIRKYSPYIYLYNIEHKYVLTFETITKAFKVLTSLGFRVTISNLSKCKLGNQKQTGGFIVGRNKEELMKRVCAYTNEEITSVVKLIKEYNLENSQETLNWADSLNKASIEF